MNPSSSLHDYRLAYPRTAAIPTLSQSGLLHLALKREQAKSNRMEETRARRSRYLEALARLFFTPLRVFGRPALTKQDDDRRNPQLPRIATAGT
jgi:hypothetical protein